MPNYKGHLVGGIIAYGLLFFGIFAVQKPSMLVASEWLLFTLAGALFPDIDVKSKGQKYFYYVVLLFFIGCVATQRFDMLACGSFIVISPMLVRHRGIFHNPWFLMVMPLIMWFVVGTIFPRLSQRFFCDTLFFIVGAFSHIWLDFGTSQMLKRLFFIKKKNRW
jgi:membrane-bound metal-dependent hydrolase YbcI (DUF457 family)